MCFWCERVKNPDMYIPLIRPEPCEKERAYREQLKADLEKFCDEPFPNGAFIKEWNGVQGGYVPEHQRGIGITCSNGAPCRGIDKCTGWDACAKTRAVV